MSSFDSQHAQSSGSISGEPAQASQSFSKEWLQPPKLTLGALLPMNRELARTPRGVIALVEIRAYPTGCWFEVMAAVERPQDVATLQQVWRLYADPRLDASGPPREALSLGVALPDGRTTTVFRRVPTPPGEDPPDPPVLSVLYGRVAEVPEISWLQLTLGIWLWPLPPPEPFELILDYPLIELTDTHVEMDGMSISAAAKRSIPLLRNA